VFHWVAARTRVRDEVSEVPVAVDQLAPEWPPLALTGTCHRKWPARARVEEAAGALVSLVERLGVGAEQDGKSVAGGAGLAVVQLPVAFGPPVLDTHERAELIVTSDKSPGGAQSNELQWSALL
jgi:hypothetical protein